MGLRLTQHAHERALERVGRLPNLRGAVPVPMALLRKFGVRQHKRKGARYFGTPSTLLVVSGRRVVVTCIAMPEGLYAELVTRELFRRTC